MLLYFKLIFKFLLLLCSSFIMIISICNTISSPYSLSLPFCCCCCFLYLLLLLSLTLSLSSFSIVCSFVLFIYITHTFLVFEIEILTTIYNTTLERERTRTFVEKKNPSKIDILFISHPF